LRQRARSDFHPNGRNSNFTLLKKTEKKFRGIISNEETYRVIFNDRNVIAFASAAGGRANQTVLLLTASLGVA
jgi:hypothetical protein